MKVIIAGAGSVGRSIAKELVQSGHDITIIDRHPSAMKVASVPEAEWQLDDACELTSLQRANLDEADVVEGARAIGLTLGVPSAGQVGLVEDAVVDRAFGPDRFREAIELFSLGDLAQLAPAGADLPVHIVCDAMAAAALGRAAGVAPEDVRAALRAFRPGAHRIELAATVDGVRYVDDSKATNAHAARASLGAQADGTTVWIVGGLAKGGRFEDLVADVSGKLRAVVVIGRRR